MPFSLPDAEIVAAIDAQPAPITVPAPGGRRILLVYYEAHPPIWMLARPVLRLAGLKLDPVIGGRQRTRRFSGLSVLDVATGRERRLALPDGAQISIPTWAPDAARFAFTVDEADGIGVWVGDASGESDPVQVPGLRVTDVLGGQPPALGGTVRWTRDGDALLVLGRARPGEQSRAGEQSQAGQPRPGEQTQPAHHPQGGVQDQSGGGTDPIEPRIWATSGKQSQMATYQDLLATAADEDRFEAIATTVPLRVDPVTGLARTLGEPGLYQYLEESPDREYLLVYRLRRPFSYRVPYGYFARSIEVRTAGGEPVSVVADLPVSDEVPRMGVPLGPRQVSWDERAPARLIWAQALDGGDPVAPAEYRDAIMTQQAPFDHPAQEAFRMRHRCVGWLNADAPNQVMLSEHDRDRRWITTWLCDPEAPERNRVIFDLSEDDAYGDPGSPMMRLHPDGSRTLRQDGQSIYLRGDGATPEGERPFLDRLDLVTGEKARLFRSAADQHESVLCFADGRTDHAVIWRESPAEPPNLWVVQVGEPGGATEPGRRLTAWPDPHPQLTGIEKRLTVTDRGDGVQLSGMLHLPPGYDPARDGRLPLVIWAYPYDFGTAGTAGQVRGSSTRFTRLTASDPAWFVLRGYAVLANATMPVIGDPETKNDTYVEQIVAAATAHVKALTEAGIADPARVAVSGHSYGAFMTATLLAHTDLFTAGIARSGAYNRTLTPFGFQTERRSFWEAPAIYDQVSPFRYANRIKAPLLLVHGADDANSGTFPIQSERLFQAIQGNGGTARLVILPFENHGYLARESVLHVLAEQFDWLGRWFGPDGGADADGGEGGNDEDGAEGGERA